MPNYLKNLGKRLRNRKKSRGGESSNTALNNSSINESSSPHSLTCSGRSNDSEREEETKKKTKKESIETEAGTFSVPKDNQNLFHLSDEGNKNSSNINNNNNININTKTDNNDSDHNADIIITLDKNHNRLWAIVEYIFHPVACFVISIVSYLWNCWNNSTYNLCISYYNPAAWFPVIAVFVKKQIYNDRKEEQKEINKGFFKFIEKHKIINDDQEEINVDRYTDQKGINKKIKRKFLVLQNVSDDFQKEHDEVVNTVVDVDTVTGGNDDTVEDAVIAALGLSHSDLKAHDIQVEWVIEVGLGESCYEMNPYAKANRSRDEEGEYFLGLDVVKCPEFKKCNDVPKEKCISFELFTKMESFFRRREVENPRNVKMLTHQYYANCLSVYK